MTNRMWTWAGGLGAAGLLFLGLSLHSALTWTPPAGTDAVLTLNQVLGFIVSGGMLIMSVLVFATGYRRHRDNRRRRAFAARLKSPR